MQIQAIVTIFLLNYIPKKSFMSSLNILMKPVFKSILPTSYLYGFCQKKQSSHSFAIQMQSYDTSFLINCNIIFFKYIIENTKFISCRIFSQTKLNISRLQLLNSPLLFPHRHLQQTLFNTNKFLVPESKRKGRPSFSPPPTQPFTSA